jgi:hypothetical protein
MQPAIEAFYPAGAAVVLVTSTTTAEVQLPVLPSRVSASEVRQLQIANNSTSWLFIKQGSVSGNSAVVKVDYPVAPGAVVVITLRNDTTYIAGILLAGVGEAYLQLGGGL